MKTAWIVLVKELRDALRDRRTLLVSLLLPLAAGPVVFALLSTVISDVEERVARREVVIAHQERAPTLVNFLQRAGATILPAPPDYREQMRSGKLQNAVIVPAEDFEAQLARAQTATVEAVYDRSHDKAQAVVRSALQLVEGFNREAGIQRLLARGVDPRLAAALKADEVNLAAAQARGAPLLFIVPWVALLVSVFGALAVAIDVTAGERERGSLEPLLGNPVEALAIVVGKWGVVMLYALAIVLLTMAGFMVSMRLISNETLAALMQLEWREIGVFAAALLPFAGLMAAVNMLAASFGRSFREAQTIVSYISLAVPFAAIVPVFVAGRDASWQPWVPSVGQMSVLMKTLRGEAFGAVDLVIPALVCAVGTALCLGAQARLMRSEALVFARS